MSLEPLNLNNSKSGWAYIGAIPRKSVRIEYQDDESCRYIGVLFIHIYPYYRHTVPSTIPSFTFNILCHSINPSTYSSVFNFHLTKFYNFMLTHLPKFTHPILKSSEYVKCIFSNKMYADTSRRKYMLSHKT